MNAYVVNHWHASTTPDREGNYVHIAGRKAGLVDYLLTMLKLNSRVLLKVSDSGVVFSESSVFADRNVNTPLAKITSTIYGWKRPFWEAVFISLGVILFLGPAVVTLSMVLGKEDKPAIGLASFLVLVVFVGRAAQFLFCKSSDHQVAGWVTGSMLR